MNYFIVICHSKGKFHEELPIQRELGITRLTQTIMFFVRFSGADEYCFNACCSGCTSDFQPVLIYPHHYTAVRETVRGWLLEQLLFPCKRANFFSKFYKT